MSSGDLSQSRQDQNSEVFKSYTLCMDGLTADQGAAQQNSAALAVQQGASSFLYSAGCSAQLILGPGSSRWSQQPAADLDLEQLPEAATGAQFQLLFASDPMFAVTASRSIPCFCRFLYGVYNCKLCFGSRVYLRKGELHILNLQ